MGSSQYAQRLTSRDRSQVGSILCPSDSSNATQLLGADDAPLQWDFIIDINHTAMLRLVSGRVLWFSSRHGANLCLSMQLDLFSYRISRGVKNSKVLQRRRNFW
jgi:hypothetical protein